MWTNQAITIGPGYVFRCCSKWKCDVNVHCDIEGTRTYLKTYNNVQLNGFRYNLFSYCSNHSSSITCIVEKSTWNASFAFPGICLCFLEVLIQEGQHILWGSRLVGKVESERLIFLEISIYIFMIGHRKNATYLATIFFFCSHFEVEN